MLIRDMFEKEIDREIKGVIKVGQKDAENVYQELDEYVVTAELSKYMNRFFDAYNRSNTGRTDNMGVWISGFFGSGKSHFLKILSYILSNRVVENEKGEKKEAVKFFTEGIKVEDSKLQSKIAEVAKESQDIDVILFNVDSKSTTDSKIIWDIVARYLSLLTLNVNLMSRVNMKSLRLSLRNYKAFHGKRAERIITLYRTL